MLDTYAGAMMRVMFLHQNMPGQFKHLAPHLARDPANEVVFVTSRQGVELPGVRTFRYRRPDSRAAHGHPYLLRTESAIRYGQAVVRACLALKKQGFRPDIVIGHTGWGETLFIKEIFPAARLLGYCEFYYHAFGADADFLPLRPRSVDQILRTRARNAHLLLGLEACDWGISPTNWQKQLHPAAFQSKISVIFDGIDTQRAKPDPAAVLELPGGGRLTADDEVVTYVSRDLEPYRGFAQFMAAVPRILDRRPNAHVVIVGGDGNGYYGDPPPDGGTWRETVLAGVTFDRGRVHFLGRVPYSTYLKLLQISSAHVYLTVPFVLSWSMLEAMAAGCLIIGSATAPVQEVIEHGRNGLLVDFFDSGAIAAAAVAALRKRPERMPLRQAARRTVLERYDLADCLHQQLGLIEGLAGTRSSAVAAAAE